MSADPMIHDLTEWRAAADRAVALRDDLTALTDGLSGNARERIVKVGGDLARSGIETLVDGLVANLRSSRTKLDIYVGILGRSSSLIAAADGDHLMPTAAARGLNASWNIVGALYDSPLLGDAEKQPSIVAALCPDIWPTADVAGMRCATTALRRDARRLAAAVDRLAQPLAISRGRAAGALTAQATYMAGPRLVGDSVRAMIVASDALDAYAIAASHTRDDMRTIAARVECDQARGRVLSAFGAEPALVEPAAAGRLALAASGEDYRTRVDDIGRRHAEQLGNAGSGASTPPLSVGALSGVVGAGAVGGMPASAMSRRREQGAGTTIDTVAIGRRVRELAGLLPLKTDVRMAVGLAVADTGDQIRVVATSDDHDYLRSGVTLGSGEWFVGRGEAPEFSLLELCAQVGGQLVAIASTTPPSESVRERLSAQRVRVVE
ncbi:hypothetical protein [Gordonia sp. CPCC 205333]|uniref:hypothetical protein n=1 Tax=Gordonia sp. CPCC 205333 TaxID=3140790 RepID=UPI003AF3B804